MAHITADRVKQTSTSIGIGSIELTGSLIGFRNFSSVLAVGDTFWYAIASAPGSEWEVGLGTYSALNTITRTTVLSSSNSNTVVTFSAGSKEVFITAAASKFLQADSAGSYGNFTAGTITGALTGNASGSAATFTSTTQNSQFNSVGVNVTPTAKLDINGTQVANIVAVAALDVNCSLGNYFTKTIASNSTFTFSSVPTSRAYSFILELTHTLGSVTWPAAVQWPSGTAPTLTTGKTHLFVFVTDDGGTRWRGSSSTNYTN